MTRAIYLSSHSKRLSRIGLQRGAIERFQPEGLDTSLKLLPEYLQEAGYNTHLVRRVGMGGTTDGSNTA